MTRFSLKHTVKYYGLREGKQRLEKFVKYMLFAKGEQKLEKIIKNMPFEQQREHFGGQSRAFSWKKPMFLFFLHNRKPVFYVVFGGEKRPQSVFWCPKGMYFTGISKLSLPSAENREEPRILL